MELFVHRVLNFIVVDAVAIQPSAAAADAAVAANTGAACLHGGLASAGASSERKLALAWVVRACLEHILALDSK